MSFWQEIERLTMDTELKKKIEEASKEIADKKFPKHRASENDRRAREAYQLCRDSCIIGIELGYKEAIALAKKWLKDNLGYYDYNVVYIGETRWDHIAKDFESDMNKLWEENK